MVDNVFKQCKRLKAKLSDSATLSSESIKAIKAWKRAARMRSKTCDKIIKEDWKSEEKYIKLLLLGGSNGPGEAGKSTLIKQMQLIHGEELNLQERESKIPYIRHNIFDSMVAILVAMREFDIHLEDPTLESVAQRLLRHSQVCNPHLMAKDILYSDFLKSEECLNHVAQLWEDEGVKTAYSRSNEYQLLDCAAYFFDRIQDINQADYVPTEQDVLRCRVMTTSIQETKVTVPYGSDKVNFKVLDVGGQQGERRKWIALFDKVTAVLFVTDVSGFDQTLREDSKTNRLLESLKVFYQAITTKYLRSVSVLTFMNKIDILKQKIERGADFEAALEKIKEQAQFQANNSDISTHDALIYERLHNILVDNPFSSYKFTEHDRKTFSDAFPVVEVCPCTKKHAFRHNHHKKVSVAGGGLSDEVVKVASYLKMLLMKIIYKVEECHPASSYSCQEPIFRSYEFHYTCAVDKANVRKVIDGCKNILVKQHLAKMGIDIS